MPQRIDVDRALELVGGGAPLIDVLPDSVYRKEHLPEAINVPLGTFRPEQLGAFDRSRPIVVYCFDQH